MVIDDEMMLMCSGASSNATSPKAVSSDAVADSSADTVTADNPAADSVAESTSPVNVRPKRRSMALAIDSDLPPESDDVRHLSNCLPPQCVCLCVCLSVSLCVCNHVL